MKLRSLESMELMLMTGLGVIATFIALVVGHARTEMMIVLTLLMALMAFIARFRHRREIRTLKAKGKRKRPQPGHEG